MGRAVLLILLAESIVAMTGCGIAALAGFDPHAREMAAAAAVCAVACGAAMVPLVLARGAGQAAVAQAALVATVLHLFVAISTAGAIYLLKLIAHGAFLYWLLAFYWSTLAVLATACARAVRAADPAAPRAAPPAEAAAPAAAALPHPVGEH